MNATTTTQVTTTTNTATIAEQINGVHIYDELAFSGHLYEMAVKVITWVLDMNPKDVDEWIELHSRHYSASHDDAQKWLDFNESNHTKEEWDKMIVLLSKNYEGIKKLRSMERLEKAVLIGEMIEAAIDPKNKGIF